MGSNTVFAVRTREFLEHLSEAVMLRANGEPVQSWRKIAAEAAKETDPTKLVEIIDTIPIPSPPNFSTMR
jgi:hypothetical protein